MNAIPEDTRLGWIGLGIMGKHMASHLISKRFRLTVHSRTRDSAAEIIAKGASWADSPRAVAENSDIVFSMVGTPDDVQNVHLGAGGSLAGLRSGGVVVDMSTSTPTLAVAIAESAAKRGIVALDAPVSGGETGARDASLSIMVGGDQVAFDALKQVWSCLGTNVIYQGNAGAGQHAKMVNQIMIAGTMVGLCEGMIYAKKAGLNMERMLRSVSSGAAQSWSLTNLGPQIVGNDYRPGFSIQHFLKDLKIAEDEANQLGIQVPGLAVAAQLYSKAVENGLGQLGTHALYKMFEG